MIELMRTGRTGQTGRTGRTTRRVATLAVAAVVGALVATGAASAAPPAGDGVSGRYIVVLHNGVDPGPAADDAARAEGAQVERVYRSALQGYVATMSPQAAANLARNPNVASVEADQVVTAFGEVPTGVDRAEADQKLNLGTGGNVSLAGSDVDVAVVDTGIDHTHPDLNVVDGANCAKGGPFAQSCADGLPGDGNGHGTHVAGTIGAKDDGQGVVGVAPGIRLHAVRVLGNNGSGYMSWIAAGLDWVVAHGNVAGISDIEVVNMSLGCQCTSQALDTAIQGAVDAGVTVVVAAGNDNADASSFSPANNPNVVAVGALADFDGLAGGAAASTCRADQDDTRADFSNYGSMVDIAAPGVCIESTWPGGGYNTISGTSMASPHVAGAAALYLEDTPTLTAGPARAAAVRTALQGAGWSVSPGDPCGYAVDGKPIGNLLLLATPCGVATGTGGGGGGTGTTPGTQSAHVSEIRYSETGKNGRDLNVTVTLLDGSDQPIPTASVTITLTNTTTGSSGTATATTNSTGQASFKLRNAAAGVYQTHIDAVAPASLGWDGITPTNSYLHSTATSGAKGNGNVGAAGLLQAA